MGEGDNNIMNNKNAGNVSTETKGSNIRGNIAEVLQNTADPSKAPLNYINNMNEWKEIVESYKQAVRESGKALLSALESAEDKKAELDEYNKQKIKLDIELKENEGTMYRKLSQYVDFINKVYDNVQDLLKDESEQEESDGTYSIPLQIRYDDKNNKIIVTANRETTQAEQEQISGNILGSFQEKGIDITNMGVDYIVDPNFQYEDKNDSTKDVLQQYLKLINPDKYNNVLKKLKFSEKAKLKKIKKELEKYVEKYAELNTQIYLLLEKIEEIENEYKNCSKESELIEDTINDMSIDIEKKARKYSLNSYLSTKIVSLEDFVATPTVEKQVKYILELNKRGLPMPKTILLYGGHNLGKTYTANVLATELNRKMYHIKSCDIKNSEFPDAGAMIDGVFSQAIEEKEPCIIFLDEIEKFSKGLEGSIYQDEIENTIRHHISKIKESNLDIIIIGAISDKSKTDPSLMKGDVFSKQIDFEPFSDDKCTILFQKLFAKKKLELGDDVILQETVSKIGEKNPEYIKKFVETIADCHLLNTLNPEDNIVSQEDIDEAFKIMGAYSRNSSGYTGFNR